MYAISNRTNLTRQWWLQGNGDYPSQDASIKSCHKGIGLIVAEHKSYSGPGRHKPTPSKLVKHVIGHFHGSDV